MKKLLFLLLILVPWSVMAQDNDENRDSVRSNTKYGELFLKKGVSKMLQEKQAEIEEMMAMDK